MSGYGRTMQGQPPSRPPVNGSSTDPNRPSAPTTNSSSSTNSALSGNNLPAEPDQNDDAPPPYTPVADPRTEQTAEVNLHAPYVAQGQAGRPPQSRPPAMPPRPDTQQQFPPPPQRLQSGNSGYPGSSTYSYSGGKTSGPMSPTEPPPQPPRPPQQQYRPPGPNVPWIYPPGYYCYKCNNSGVKIKNGKQCQDCYARFARQNAAVYRAPTLYMPGGIPGFGSVVRPVYGNPGMPGQTPVVVQPGDPRIGGIQCGRCRGRGMIGDLLGEYNCPTCGGIGRLL